MSEKTIAYIVTCEHGGNRIPSRYQPLFRGVKSLLESHRGYDAGALTMARALSRMLDAPLIASTVSRLLIELNRSPHNHHLYSPVMRRADPKIRETVFQRYYMPYRRSVETAVADAVAAGHRAIHVSSHSFTPVLDGVVRDADVGLLYDPARKAEAAFVLRWKTALESHAPDWRIRRNYPYTGTNDGLTTYLRTRFPDHLYAGIELEINQKHVLEDRRAWTMTRAVILRALAETVGSSPHGRAGERGLAAGRAARPLYVR